MVTVGLLVRMLATPGKDNEVAHFLEDILEMVRDEPSTTAWFGVRFSARVRHVRCLPRRSGSARTPDRSGRTGAQGERVPVR